MEKIKVNNQIVNMRKFVKQAKVHIINKLTKQVQLLQNRKGSEAQIEKCKRKAKRYLEEITLLKGIKPDNVSKLALSKARDWKEVLQEKTSALDERCLAMLSSFGAVQKEVESFHSSYPDLVPKIPSLVKEMEEKNKFSKVSPFDKRKQKLDTYNSRKNNNIPSNAFESPTDKISPGSVKKLKVGIHEELDELDSKNDVLQEVASNEGVEHESESEKKSKNRMKQNIKCKLNYNKLSKISPVKLPGNIESAYSSDEGLENDNNIMQEDKKYEIKESKNQRKQVRCKEISNKLQSKMFPVKSENTESGTSSDEDLRSDNDVVQDVSIEEQSKNVGKNYDRIQKIKCKRISNKFQNKISPLNSTKNVESDKSSDEELYSDDENLTNNTDLVKAGREKNVSESDRSESVDENVIEQMMSDDSETSDFFQKPGGKRKLSCNQKLSAKGMAESKEPVLDKPIMLKQKQSNLSNHFNRNTTEKNLKTIAVLNLNDLQGLDEIPIEEKTEDEESDEEHSAQKTRDPFFLRPEELDPAIEDRANIYSENGRNPYIPKNSKFPRNEESNLENKSFQKSFSASHFSRQESYKFNNERNFEKNGFQSKDSTNRFEHKGRGEFQNRDKKPMNRKERRAFEAGNQGDFHTKGKNGFRSIDFDRKGRNEYQPGDKTVFNRKEKNGFKVFSKESNENLSRKSNFQNEGNTSFRKDRMPNKKGNVTSEKLLHPSWEAKRKQKELAQIQFQGKKKIFDD